MGVHPHKVEGSSPSFREHDAKFSPTADGLKGMPSARMKAEPSSDVSPAIPTAPVAFASLAFPAFGNLWDWRS